MAEYSWDTEIERNKKVYVLVIYDIVNDKRRTRMVKCLNGYGFRVQKSAFEAKIDAGVYRRLLDKIPTLINKEEDSVRVYKIIGSGEVSLFGVNTEIEAANFMII